MRQSSRHIRLPFVSAVAACLLVASCGGSKHHTAATPPTTLAGGPAASALSPTVPGGTTTTSPAAGTGTTATTAKSGGTTITTSSPTTSPVVVKSAVPIKPGTYTYTQSGTVTSGTSQQSVAPTGTLVADAAQADGTQVAHLNFDPSFQPDLTYSFTKGGMFLVTLALRSGTATVVCNMASPVPLPPWPLVAGQTFNGSATCNFGETATISGSVGQPSQYAIPGLGTRTVWELDATITAQGTAQATSVIKSLFSPDLRVPATLNTDSSGTFGLTSFHAVVQDKLKSIP
jgi:hypothetical protein